MWPLGAAVAAHLVAAAALWAARPLAQTRAEAPVDDVLVAVVEEERPVEVPALPLDLKERALEQPRDARGEARAASSEERAPVTPGPEPQKESSQC
jgi:hypothetical protein